VVACPNCQLRRWYPIERLSENHLCDGCQVVTMPTPVGADQLQWRYRLNELVAHAADQGVLPHNMLAVGYVEAWDADWGIGERSGFLGLMPGLLFEPMEDGGPPAIEVDLFAILSRRTILGECKARGDTLTGHEAERLAALATRLRASRLIFASPTDFSTVSSVIEAAQTLGAPARVYTWERGDLLDTLAGDVPSDEAPRVHLERLARRLETL
jgi:hypothetical protein